jgi:septation ring formation regulator EzrA
MKCPKCNNEIECLAYTEDAVISGEVYLDDNDNFEFKEQYQEPVDSSAIISCPECDEEFSYEEAKNILKSDNKNINLTQREKNLLNDFIEVVNEDSSNYGNEMKIIFSKILKKVNENE